MEGLCPCGHEPTGSIVPVSELVSFILFNILKYLMKNCFLNTGGVNIEGRRNKGIRFSDDMALLAEDERMLKNMLMELKERCEDYGMKIHVDKPCEQQEISDRLYTNPRKVSKFA